MHLSLASLILAQVKLEDVFKSAQENMTETPGSARLIAFFLGCAGMILLLALLQQLRKRSATLTPVNHHGRLVKEITKSLSLKSAELRQLKRLSDQQSCSSPLTLLLCPSLLSKAIESQPAARRKSLDKLVERVSQDPPSAD